MTAESIPIEYGAFGLIFRQPGAISHFVENLTPDQMGALHGNTGFTQFYLALLDFHHRTGLDPVDPIAFQSWLETESEVAIALGGYAGVKVFIELACSADLPSPEAVVAVLRHKANKRLQVDALQELQLLVTRKEHKHQGDDGRIVFLTEQIRALEQEVGYDPLSFVETGHDLAGRGESLLNLPDFLPTQYPALNRVLGYDEVRGGFVRGGIYAILATTGHGKSTLARCLMTHWVEGGSTALFVNYEEPASMWERSLLIQLTKRNIYEAPEPSAEEEEEIVGQYNKVLTGWGDRFMVRHDPETPYFEDLERWLRDILGHNARVPEVVIIDTIQSMFTKGSGSKPRWGQYEEMMVRLEKLAKDMHCVMIITAQENRDRVKEGREVVQISDIGGSIAIAQKATVTMHLTQKRNASHDESVDENVMEVQISKNRITGTRYSHDPALIRYDDATKSYYPWDASSHGSRSKFTTQGFLD
jgi:replicative DNA helicase